MEEFLYYGELFDIYGNLLNESNKKYYQLYYEENLTLQEIADLEQVSKSYLTFPNDSPFVFIIFILNVLNP